MIEATGATLMVALVLVASLRASQVTVFAQRRAAESAQAAWLGKALLAEITQLAYQSPTAPVLFGPESGETSRSLYNDVDDYNGYSDSPLQNKDGTLLPNLTGWQRKVTVQWVSPTNVTQTSATESGAKLVTVTVLHNSIARATRVGVRTNAP